jgi:hypothetical protein
MSDQERDEIVDRTDSENEDDDVEGHALHPGIGKLDAGPNKLDSGPNKLDSGPNKLDSGPNKLDGDPA